MASNFNSKDSEDVLWENQLIWYPRADEREHVYPFSQDELPRFFEDWNCKFKASEEFVRKIYHFGTPLAGALAGLFTHDYIIVETNKNRFFCFAKAASHIEILCAYNIEHIHDSQYQGPGAKHVFRAFRQGPLDISDKNHTIADIVKWIFNSGEITRGYSALNWNCQVFADRLYTKLAGPEY